MLPYFSRFQQPMLRFLIRSQDKSWKLWPELFNQGIVNWQDSTHQPESLPAILVLLHGSSNTLNAGLIPWYSSTQRLGDFCPASYAPFWVTAPPVGFGTILLYSQHNSWIGHVTVATSMRFILSFIHSLACLFNTYYKPGTGLGAGDNKQNIKTPALVEFRYQNFGGSYLE